MRTNVVIDDDLMNEALKASGLKTKKDAIEAGLRLLVKFKQLSKIRKYSYEKNSCLGYKSSTNIIQFSS